MQTMSDSSLIENPKMADLYMMPSQCLDEPTLIFETQHGDLESFNRLVLAYQDYLFNTAMRILGDDELAADATQKAFISAYRSIKSYRSRSLKVWLMRTVTNACYDELRRQKRHPTVPLEPDNHEETILEHSRWLTDSSMLPEARCEAAELSYAIQHCLDALPTDFRTVLFLVDVQGMNYSEVARAAQVPLGTVKSRLARARLRMREHLQRFHDLLPTTFHLDKENPH
jgi:RNA polymerase sigma-70 factor (ECF subfamily)